VWSGKLQEARAPIVRFERAFLEDARIGESTVPELTAPAPPADGRVSTGNPGLDAMLEGGLVPRRPYLIVGPSGTGKTTLAIQFLCEGVRRGERVLLVTIEEPPNEARINHRGLEPELSQVHVFDAIPDIMRYERVPFKDIASVRSSVEFKEVPLVMRRSPELSAVEVTMTGLEQMLRTEVTRRNYTRLVIDSLTALQYFCMKGFDPVAGAQTFLRFISDLRVTTVLTVESPLEDVETPERALARGEIRLFRWELEGQTVRAIGVEKFRGSPHDVRLHPYRIGPKGIDINLKVTISRDTREIIQSWWPAETMPTPVLLEESTSPIDPLAEVVRDLVLVGADVGPTKTEIEAALGAVEAGDSELSRVHLSRAIALAFGLSDSVRDTLNHSRPRSPDIGEAYQRIVQRGEAVRAGLPPTRLPLPKVLQLQLEQVLSLIPSTAVPTTPAPAQPEPSVAAGPALSALPEVLEAESPRSGLPESPVPPPAAAPPAPAEPGGVTTVSVSPEPELPPAAPSTPALSVKVAERTTARPPPAAAPQPRALGTIPPAPPTSPVPEPPPLPTLTRPHAVVTAPRPVPGHPASGVPHGGSPAPGRAHVARPEERPPLPTLLPVPPPGQAPPPSPTAPPIFPTGRSPGPAVQPPVPVSVSFVPPSPVTAPDSVAVQPAARPVKRRRRTTSAPRRKSPAAAVPSPPAEGAPAQPAGTGAPTGPERAPLVAPESGSLETVPVPGTAPTTKPKKRTARKRKAPTVVAATPGIVPPAEPSPPVERTAPDATPESPREGE